MSWKNYFYFTKKEKIGILLFFAIILLIFTIKLLIPESVPEEIPDLPVQESVKPEEKKPYSSDWPERKKSYASSKSYSLYAFDPNTADSLVLVGLGIRPYIAKNIIKYRSKGGRFRKPDDFAKVYGMTPEKFRELQPYIRIENQEYAKPEAFTRIKEEGVVKDSSSRKFLSEKKDLPYSGQEKYPSGVKVDISVADTAELIKIPNIGIVFARRIVKYRQMLGGYCQIDQLREVYGMSPELFEKIQPWLVVENPQLVLLPVNRSSVERLKSHPYLNFYQAKAIVELKKKKGKLQGISDLSLLEEFSETDLQRISLYLSFD